MLARRRRAGTPGGERAKRIEAHPGDRNSPSRRHEARAAGGRPALLRRDFFAHHDWPTPQQEGLVFAFPPGCGVAGRDRGTDFAGGFPWRRPSALTAERFSGDAWIAVELRSE